MVGKSSCAVGVILRPTRNLVRHLTQEVAYGNHMLAFSPFVDDRVGVVIEDALIQRLQIGIQLEPRVRCGESGNEDVSARVGFDILRDAVVDRFQDIVSADAKGLEVLALIIEDVVQMGGNG